MSWFPCNMRTLWQDSAQKVHYYPVSGDIVMKVVDKPEAFVRVNQYQYLSDILHQQRARVAQVADSESWRCSRMDGSISEGISGIQGQRRRENGRSTTRSKGP